MANLTLTKKPRLTLTAKAEPAFTMPMAREACIVMGQGSPFLPLAPAEIEKPKFTLPEPMWKAARSAMKESAAAQSAAKPSTAVSTPGMTSTMTGVKGVNAPGREPMTTLPINASGGWGATGSLSQARQQLAAGEPSAGALLQPVPTSSSDIKRQIDALTDKQRALRSRAQPTYKVTSRPNNFRALMDEVSALQPQIDRLNEKWNLAKGVESEELRRQGWRDATPWDLTLGSLSRGFTNARYGIESFKRMMGQENDAQKYREQLAGDDYKFITDKWWEDAVSGSAEQLGQQGRQLLDPRTAASIGALGAGGAMLGSLGGGVGAIPGALSGAAAGFRAGSAMVNYEIEAGQAYNEMRANGIKPDTARNIALIVGGANAAIEFIQVDELVKSLRIMKNSGMDTAAQRVAKYLAGNAMGVGNNVLQEVLQEGATMGGVEAAQQYQTGEHAYSFDEVMNRLGDTAASSALTFGTMSLPDAVRNITHIAGGPRTAGGSSVTLPAGADSGVSMMPGVTVDNFPASPLEAGKYRANRPRNVEYPTVPIIHLSMDDVARLNGGKLPEKGGFLRKAAIEHARRRLGLDRHSAVFIPASNVLRNGEEYVLKITKASLDKMFSPSDHSDVPVETVAIMENLERIANNGVYFKSEGDRKRRDQILGVDHLMTTVYIDNVPYIVDMRVRVAETGVGTHSNNVLYYFSPEEITTIKKADGSTPAAGRHASDGGAPPPTGITIPPMGGGVNIREMRSQGGAFQPGRGLGGQARKVELLPVWGARDGMTAAPSVEIGAPNFVPLPIFDSQLGARGIPALPVWGTQGGTAAAPSVEIVAPNFVPLPIFDGRLGARSTTALPMQGTKGGETVDNPGENGIIVGKGTEGAEDVGKIITEIKYKPSSGVIFEANPDKTTTILGSYEKDMKNVVNEMGNVKSTYFGAKKGGFNVLNVPDDMYKSADQFWEEINKPWLDEAIKRGDDIVLATKPEGKYLYRFNTKTHKREISGFGREYKYLRKNGYVYDNETNTMIRR